jgi:UDP-GlcNAc:undecaprenyl-phosphate GlcNAc-1-phosphate transferase
VAIFFGFIFSLLLWSNEKHTTVLFPIVVVLIIPFIVGLIDDVIHVRPYVKLVTQTITATFVFFVLDIGLISDYGLFGGHIFHVIPSYIVTVVTIIVITNSFNLIDGIDGLAGAFSFMALLYFGIWFYSVDDISYAFLCFTLLGGIFAFLLFNWEPSRVFMGDTGALLIGTVLSILTIRFLNSNYALNDNSLFKFKGSIATAICIVIIPIVDTLRVIVIRISKGISPLKADKRHIHHGLVQLGLRHREAVILLICVHIIFMVLANLFSHYGDYYLLPSIIIISSVLVIILDQAISKKTAT